MNWTIGKKLALGFGTLIFILVLTGLISQQSVHRINRDVRQLAEVKKPFEQSTLEMEIRIGDTVRGVLDYLRGRDPQAIQQIHDAAAEFKRQEDQYFKLADTEEEKKLGGETVQKYEAMKTLGEETVALEDKELDELTALRKDAGEIDRLLSERIQNTVGQTAPEVKEKLEASLEMESSLQKALSSLERLTSVVESDPRLKEALRAAETDFERFEALYRKAGLTSEEETWLASIDRSFQETKKFSEDILSVEDDKRAKAKQFEKNQKEADDILDQQVQPLLAQDVAKVSEGAKRAGNQAMFLIICFTLLGLVIGVVVGFTTTRSIVNPLKKLVSVTGILAKGDLTAPIDIQGRDEIGQLADSFRSMIEGFRGILRNALTNSEGVSSSSQDVSATAQQMNATAQEVASTVQQIAKGAESTAQRVQETSRVMEGMNVQVSQVASSAQQAASASVQANQSAQKGGEAAKEAVTKMQRIYQTVTSSAVTVKKLGERSDEITEIVNVITNIADQTNLLALNAAIEAARAGEAGRGFAVVAEEVRKLAEGSAKAADQIGGLIKEVQKETELAVKGMEQGSEEVAQGRETVTAAGQALQEIVKAVENTATMVEQISASAGELAQGSKQVVKSIDDIAATAEEASSATEEASASAEEMTASMEEMATSAQEMAELAKTLGEAVSKFKVDGRETQSPLPETGRLTPLGDRQRKLRETAQKLEATRQRFAERREPLQPLSQPRKGPDGGRRKQEGGPEKTDDRSQKTEGKA